MVRCRDGSLYTGIATDVARRLAEHAAPGGKGAKYLRGRGPLRLVFTRRAATRAVALRLERRVKRLPKARKEALVKRPALFDRWAEFLGNAA
jgi:putative endonuclease